MTEMIGDEFNFKIITGDRDLGDRKPYKSIRVDAWNRVQKTNVFYCSSDNKGFIALQNLINNTKHDMLYINSFFDWHYSIKPLLLLKLRFIRKKPVLLAPRGEFSVGALLLKSRKKKIYIKLAKILMLYNNVTFQASNQYEKTDIVRCIGSKANVLIAPDMVMPPISSNKISTWGKNNKERGKLKIFFLSRISPKKNLLTALKILKNISGQIIFDIYGPIEDANYWERCKKEIKSLPSHVKVKYAGPVDSDNVKGVMSQYHLFLFPTLGENFGHVIIEALSVGCPVLISNKTPWQNLEEEGIGWDLPLERIKDHQAIIERCVSMDSYEHEQYSIRAYNFANRVINDEENLELNRKILKEIFKQKFDQ
jgi:glycosyltransferase involved in cell wall biosynthesis